MAENLPSGATVDFPFLCMYLAKLVPKFENISKQKAMLSTSVKEKVNTEDKKFGEREFLPTNCANISFSARNIPFINTQNSRKN